MVEAKMVKGLAPDLYDVRPCYMISSNGILYGHNGKPTCPHPDKDGYLVAGMSCWPNKRNKYIRLHKLVALAFLPDCLLKMERGLEIDHKDGDKRNNDITNLRLVTSSENKRNPKTRYNTRAMQNAVKVQVVNVSDERKLEFESIKDASRYLGITAVSVRKAINKGYTVRKEWKVYEL